ncbi:AraC family transcriptional regulator [Streptomyces sp. NPDC096057]|uniref:AraC family transcriptional regulator n=1 Tax=Streptomyces sp. NPDC096057 TaxID=3155543 RepID=UPI0033245248
MDVLVRAATLRGWRSLVVELGGDPVALLAAARLSGDVLDDEDALLPARSAMHLLEASAVELQCPDFGLRMAHAQDPTALGPLALVLQNLPTVWDMLHASARYLFVHSPSLTLTLLPAGREFPGHVAMQFDMVLAPRPPARQAMDLALATTHRLLGLAVKTDYRPRAVLLSHSPAAPLSTYVRFFGAEVRPERAHAALILDEHLLDVPLNDVDDTIRRVAISYLETHYPAPGSSVSDLVRNATSRTIGAGARAGLDEVARMLAVHPRTLQRRLAEEGAGFDDLRDEVLKGLVYQYLTESSLPMSQVALVLGFSEQSVLTRACRRWFGQTPTALRRGER